MLKLENVHIRRGDYVVADSIDLTLEQGKVYSVLGPNGTGKSSLMKTIFGEVAHKGTIRYGDEVLSKIHLQSWRKRIGYMPQDTAAEASLTALEVVLLGRMDALHMHVGDELLHEAASIMAELGIGHLAHRDVMRLSGGQRQLVMFAQVMLRRPGILMLDEPVSALDMHHQLNLLERVVQYTHEHNSGYADGVARFEPRRAVFRRRDSARRRQSTGAGRAAGRVAGGHDRQAVQSGHRTFIRQQRPARYPPDAAECVT